MSVYVSSATVSVDNTVGGTTVLASTRAAGTYEVATSTEAVWVNHKGGTAVADGADCIKLAVDSGTKITLATGHAGITAISVSATTAKVTVSELGA